MSQEDGTALDRKYISYTINICSCSAWHGNQQRKPMNSQMTFCTTAGNILQKEQGAQFWTWIEAGGQVSGNTVRQTCLSCKSKSAVIYLSFSSNTLLYLISKSAHTKVLDWHFLPFDFGFVWQKHILPLFFENSNNGTICLFPLAICFFCLVIMWSCDVFN